MEDNAELESFRRQWREEVARRVKPSRPQPAQPRPTKPTATSSSHIPPTHHEVSERREEEDGGVASVDHSEIVHGVGHLSLGVADEDVFHSRVPRSEPKSALEHFERAVEKEAEGNLGDSLQHYRKAYRVSKYLRYIKGALSDNAGYS